ncbi:MAG: superfamily [Gaiellales bacterium]|jgi:membrane-associated phospholipid phosphatase|nr:superfamily [Gaiellales bacterium]
MRRIGVITGLAAAVAALAVLVDSGRLASLDRFARSHLSPLQAGPAGRGRGEPLQLIAGATDAIISVAGIAVSVLLVLLAARRLTRSSRPQLAGLWLGALTAGFAIELAAKAVVHQQHPDLRVICGGLGAGGFDASFPSGHAIRSMILAGMASALWPHLRWRFVLAALAVDLALLLNGIHPLSDIVAGGMAGSALWLAVESLSRRLPPRSAAEPLSAAPAAAQPASG